MRTANIQLFFNICKAYFSLPEKWQVFPPHARGRSAGFAEIFDYKSFTKRQWSSYLQFGRLRCTKKVGQRPKAMVKSNSLRVHLMVLLYDSFNSGLSHAESARIHGVGVSTSRYAARWCRRIHSAAESFVSRQGLNDLHYYRTMIARDIRESLSLQEGCARHGCPPRTYRMWEYAYYSGLLDRRESELTGRQPQKERDRDGRDDKKARRSRRGSGEGAGGRPRGERVSPLRERVPKKKDGTGGRPVRLPDLRSGRRR